MTRLATRETPEADLRAVTWWVLVGAAAGAIAGALVGGIGGRLAMLLLRLTSPDDVLGLTSDDGFEIGIVTFDTLQLVLAMAMLGGHLGHSRSAFCRAMSGRSSSRGRWRKSRFNGRRSNTTPREMLITTRPVR